MNFFFFFLKKMIMKSVALGFIVLSLYLCVCCLFCSVHKWIFSGMNISPPTAPLQKKTYVFPFSYKSVSLFSNHVYALRLYTRRLVVGLYWSTPNRGVEGAFVNGFEYQMLSHMTRRTRLVKCTCKYKSQAGLGLQVSGGAGKK
jgi:hypothetical protein